MYNSESNSPLKVTDWSADHCALSGSSREHAKERQLRNQQFPSKVNAEASHRHGGFHPRQRSHAATLSARMSNHASGCMRCMHKTIPKSNAYYGHCGVSVFGRLWPPTATPFFCSSPRALHGALRLLSFPMQPSKWSLRFRRTQLKHRKQCQKDARN